MGKRFEFDEGDGTLGSLKSNNNGMVSNTSSTTPNNARKNVPDSSTWSTSKGPNGGENPFRNTPKSDTSIPKR